MSHKKQSEYRTTIDGKVLSEILSSAADTVPGAIC